MSNCYLKEVTKRLPRRIKTNDGYGALGLISSLYGVSPRLKPRCNWVHGWQPEYATVHPENIIGTESNWSKYQGINGKWVLVSRFDQEVALRKKFKIKVKAVGLPIVYYKPKHEEIFPLKGSRLYMPTHNYGIFSNSIDAFLSGIYEKNEISCVMLSGADLRSGHYQKYEKKIHFIEGVDFSDSNAFEILEVIFRSFEVVEFGNFSSGIVYCSLFGAKPVVSQNYISNEVSNKWDIPEGYLEKIKDYIFMISRENIIQQYPFLDENYSKTFNYKEWAMFEMGFNCKVKIKDLAWMMGIVEPYYSIDLIQSCIRPKMSKMVRKMVAWK